MSAGTGIEWTEATWNPVTGCTHVSSGCDHCYAVTMTHRLETMGQARYTGLTVLNGKGDRHFNGVVRCHEDALKIPLHWRKPRRIFVNSMSDLFHRDVPFEFIDRVFAVMALTPQHTYQILTKRPERMAEYLQSERPYGEVAGKILLGNRCFVELTEYTKLGWKHGQFPWPIPGVWLGTSIEDQRAADERIPHLLKCPAAVRFISAEPLLGPVDLAEISLGSSEFKPAADAAAEWRDIKTVNFKLNALRGARKTGIPKLDWVIVGGESGPGARPCDVKWIRSIRDQCQAAGVPCFVKQLGKHAIVPAHSPAGHWPARTERAPTWSEHLPIYQIAAKDPKGGDPSEWPEDLCVREFPR